MLRHLCFRLHFFCGVARSAASSRAEVGAQRHCILDIADAAI